jgi:hypothetical protein
MASVVTTEFLEAKRIAVTARAQRLARLTPRRVGLRPQDIPYAPSAEHFQAVNQRLAQISARIARRLEHLQRIWSRRETEPKLIATAMVEREIDRARRSFGMFFEIFSQRGSSFARPLAAHDMIATDCYRAVRAAAPDVFSGALLKPVTYMEPTRRRRNAAAFSSPACSATRIRSRSSAFPGIATIRGRRYSCMRSHTTSRPTWGCGTRTRPRSRAG